MGRKLFLDEQRIWNVTLTDPTKPLENKFTLRSKMLAYFWNDYVPNAFFWHKNSNSIKKFYKHNERTKNA